MFHTNQNITNLYEATPYEKTVYEYRAPTDESVVLLREMEEAAAKNIVAKMCCNSPNEIHFHGAWFYHQAAGGYVFHYTATINGQTVEGSIKKDSRWGIILKDRCKGLHETKRAVIEDLARQFVGKYVFDAPQTAHPKD